MQEEEIEAEWSDEAPPIKEETVLPEEEQNIEEDNFEQQKVKALKPKLSPNPKVTSYYYLRDKTAYYVYI